MSVQVPPIDASLYGADARLGDVKVGCNAGLRFSTSKASSNVSHVTLTQLGNLILLTSIVRAVVKLVSVVFRDRSPAEMVRVYATAITARVSRLMIVARGRSVEFGANIPVRQHPSLTDGEPRISVQQKCERPDDALVSWLDTIRKSPRLSEDRLVGHRVSMMVPSLVVDLAPPPPVAGAITAVNRTVIHPHILALYLSPLLRCVVKIARG